MDHESVVTVDPPRRPRVDAHHHVWNLHVRDQPWITGAAMAPILRDFTIEDLASVRTGRGIDATVVVQTVASVDETVELLQLADDTDFVAGVIGYVDLDDERVGDGLDRIIDSPNGRWLVGIRHVAAAEPDPNWLMRPKVLAGLREVAERNLAYDLLIRPDQFETARQAVSAVPGGRFVLDHLGKPPIAAQELEPWARHIAALGALPNVFAKVSGLVTEAAASWTVGDLRPYVDHALASFGTGRLLFGSDWPVCLLAGSYAEVFDAAASCLAELNVDERVAVFGANAIKAYGLTMIGASA
ncbi:MAG: amidohydrolase [Ilumatobacteraceae bacterium]|nr:amidohydrolase [Ilumatobacteraceae bacterium]